MALERLQKIIAAAGIASRRKAEELIQSGLVSVNGKTVTELGSKADPEIDSVRVNQRLLKGPERHEYFALNKPRGYVTTVSDPEGRPTVMELVRSKARLYPIGRLDFNSEGLLLMTNDGELAHKLMKAASHIPKTYLVKVAGQPAEEPLRQLRAGVSIAEERDPKRRVRTAPAQIRVIKEADNPWLEVILHEGRNRQIRKMFEQIGHHVEKIRRVRYGPLELDLPPGESRPLTAREISQLKQATQPWPQRPRVNTEHQGRADRRSEIARPTFKSREPKQRPSGFRRPTQEKHERATERPQTEFPGRNQRRSRFAERAAESNSGKQARSPSSDNRPKWDDRSARRFRDRGGRRPDQSSEFRSRGAMKSNRPRWRGSQSRESRPEYAESSRRSDVSGEDERFRGKRRPSRRGTRDRRS